MTRGPHWDKLHDQYRLDFLEPRQTPDERGPDPEAAAELRALDKRAQTAADGSSARLT
jgi:hypothetical protein